MVSSRQKGIRAERQIIEILSRETGLHWEQTPGSGSGKVKGDLRVHGKHNLFCVEVKFYRDTEFNSSYKSIDLSFKPVLKLKSTFFLETLKSKSYLLLIFIRLIISDQTLESLQSFS